MRTLSITSPANPIIKEALKIRERRGKFRNASFLIEGPHLVDMALASPRVALEKVFFTEAFAQKREGRGLLERLRRSGNFTKDGALIEISMQILSLLADTKTPQGIVAIVAYSQSALDSVVFKAEPFIVVVDGVQDPGNLGAIIRASDAAGADAVALLPGACDAFMHKTVRATAGSLFTIPLVHAGVDDLVRYLAAKEITLVVADVRAKTSVFDYDFRRPTALAFGNEAHGAGEALMQSAAGLVKIPLLGRAESLNVAQSASVCLYEAVRQRYYCGGKV